MARTGLGGATVTEDQKEHFLDLLRETCNVSKAATMAGFSPKSAYNHRDKDSEFREKWEAVEIEVRDKIEGEIWRRGVEGVERITLYQGKPVATVKEYSDRMLELLARGHMPERYGDKSKVELTGKDGTPLTDTVEVARRVAFLLKQGAKLNLNVKSETEEGAALH